MGKGRIAGGNGESRVTGDDRAGLGLLVDRGGMIDAGIGENPRLGSPV